MLWKGRFAKKERPDEESDHPDRPSDVAVWLLVAALLLSFWGIVQASRTMTAAFDSNCRLPSREARTERLTILGKRCTYKKGRRNACLLTVLADDHTESIFVSGSEWDRAQVGGACTTTVWTGDWGFPPYRPPGRP
jgi:hypothetical protein